MKYFLFGVLQVQDAPPGGRLSRLADRIKQKRWLSIEAAREQKAHYYLCSVAIPENLAAPLVSSRVCYALGLLRQRGVRRVVCPALYAPLLSAFMMVPVHVGDALRTCIAPIVFSLAQAQELPLSQLCVRIRGRRMNRDIAAGAFTLAPLVRALRLDLQQRDLPLENRLLTEYGLACRGATPSGTTEVVLLLEDDRPPAGMILNLTGQPRADCLNPLLQYGDALAPPGVDTNAFFSALYLDGGGALRFEWIGSPA